ncbi:MAG: Bug family tripartite tricarboxylate transporter substrate binding protein, partial [Burkholderiales bacterium]
MLRRSLLASSIAAPLVVRGFGAEAQAQWPAKTVRFIVPFAPGGGIDGSGRIQALRMGELLKATIVVENIGGAAGTIGSQRVAKAQPDGYT